MSHFTAMKVNFKVANEKDLVAALSACFGEGNVEVHEGGSALYGYTGDNRSKLEVGNSDYAPKCHVIIRRKHVGETANDIGYRRLDDGSYDAFISEYDQDSTFTKKRRDVVAQDYTTRVAERKLKTQGYTLKRTVEANGVIKLVATRYG